MIAFHMDFQSIADTILTNAPTKYEKVLTFGAKMANIPISMLPTSNQP